MDSSRKIIAVTGGIGAGKSVVCRMLRSMGHPVYDCDLEARLLMDRSAEMRAEIAAKISPRAINPDGSICRPALSECVFSDPDKLRTLNSIVHSAVRRHFADWCARQKAPLLFVETAILYESGLDRMVTDVWEVTATPEVRIDRVMARSGLAREEVTARMAAQSAAPRPSHRIIVNDGARPLIPQIITLLKEE